MRNRLRVAVLVHGHPDFSLGGAEIAAYNLFKAYGAHPDVEEAVFLAGIQRPGENPNNLITPRRSGEYLWNREMHDWRHFRGQDRVNAYHRFAEWLRVVRPDIVHVHHYGQLGIEIFQVIRRTFPNAGIFLTLHEFQAICMNNGQMVKLGSSRLCSRESLEDCHRCYPDVSREDFWLRKQYIQGHFGAIDGFVAPSEFLRRRYVGWGIPDSRIVTIDNGQMPVEPVPHRTLGSGELRNRFGFFGQINPFKGVDILLQALEIANATSDVPIRLEVNGANLELQAPDFREKVERLRARLMETGAISWNGPYDPDHIGSRIRSVDWVVVPSIWWENSPMVIQEAYTHGRPVVASHIGGMAEKTAHGTPETHVEPRNPIALAEAMVKLANQPKLWEENVKRIPKPMTHTESAEAHLEWFGKCRTQLSVGPLRELA
ncbi:MAG: group 1 glycosyl transferase [Ahrensia sp.]|nr:group 1 glycosyl transferase [Ahrensia sp.]